MSLFQLKSHFLSRTSRAKALAERSIELHHAGKYGEADECLLESLSLSPSVHIPSLEQYDFERVAWEEDPKPGNDDRALLNVLNYSAESTSDGGRLPFQHYYDLRLGTLEVHGHRKPNVRLNLLPVDLSGKSVIDVGCNWGGMLFSSAHKIRWGIGVDRDRRLINAANRIAQNTAPDLRFYVFDLDNDPIDLLRDLIPEPRVDLAFFLAVCAHIKEWQEAIKVLASMSQSMLFEATGHEHEQLGQIRQIERCYPYVYLLADRGAPGIDGRRLFFCSHDPVPDLTRSFAVCGPFEDDPIAAHEAAKGEDFEIRANVARCRGLGIEPTNLDSPKNPFAKAARALAEGQGPEQAIEALREYYNRVRPMHAAAVLGLPDDHALSAFPPLAAVLPWEERSPTAQLDYMVECIKEFYRTHNVSLRIEDGHAHFGPVSSEKCTYEMKRLADAYDSIREHGFDRSCGVVLASVLVDDKSSEWACLVADGLHRVAASSALGNRTVPVLVPRKSAALIRRSDVDRWPHVVDGLFKRDEALHVFDTILRG